MDDENRLLEVDARVRATVNPPTSVVDRVVTRALTDIDRAPQHRRKRIVVVTVATAVLLIAVWRGRERTEEHAVPNSLAITGEGSLLVAESDDRRRWIVGPVAQRPIGASYVIVVPQ